MLFKTKDVRVNSLYKYPSWPSELFCKYLGAHQADRYFPCPRNVFNLPLNNFSKKEKFD